MRLLICASEAPLPPLNGARLVLHELSRAMAVHHDVCILAFRWPDQKRCSLPGIEFYELEPPRPGSFGRARERILSVLRGEPIDVVRLCGPMRRQLEQLRATRQFDVVHVMLGALAGVAPALANLPTVLAPLDAWPRNLAAAHAVATGTRRLWLRFQHRIVSRYVTSAYRPFTRVVLVTREDERDTMRADSRVHTVVIENGVDTEYFHPDSGIARDRRCMLFTGTLSFPPNVLAARFLATEVLPRVRRELHDVRLAIVGRNPPADVRKLAQISGVSIHANVPDVRPHLATAGVFACGMTSGTGIKNKLLEAMASGVPAVVTPLACQGLSVEDGVEVLIAASATDFAAAILRILKDEALAARLTDAARRYVVAHHSWSRLVARYEALYQELVAAHHGSLPDTSGMSAAQVNQAR